jgi:UDP-3-O-acyl-N-acetylglucosamine deacetylase
VGELAHAVEIEGPCVHSGGFGVVQIEPYENGAYFRLTPNDAPQRLSPDNYRPEFLTSAVIDRASRAALCPEHVLSSCLLVGMSGFCVTRISGPYEFPVGPTDRSYVEILLEQTGVPTAIPTGVRIESDISRHVDGSDTYWSAVRSGAPRLNVSWQHDGCAAVSGTDRCPTRADIVSIGSSRGFIRSTDVAQLQRRGRLLGAKDAGRWLQLVPGDKLSPGVLAECARHKLYDLLGDMCALGGMPLGLLEVAQPGHAVNGLIRETLVKQSKAN